MNSQKRITEMTVLPEGDYLYSERATTIKINDIGGGDFLVLSQSGRGDEGDIRIDVEEWPVLREAIDEMILKCQPGSSAE